MSKLLNHLRQDGSELSHRATYRITYLKAVNSKMRRALETINKGFDIYGYDEVAQTGMRLIDAYYRGIAQATLDKEEKDLSEHLEKLAREQKEPDPEASELLEKHLRSLI